MCRCFSFRFPTYHPAILDASKHYICKYNHLLIALVHSVPGSLFGTDRMLFDVSSAVPAQTENGTKTIKSGARYEL